MASSKRGKAALSPFLAHHYHHQQPLYRSSWFHARHRWDEQKPPQAGLGGVTLRFGEAKEERQVDIVYMAPQPHPTPSMVARCARPTPRAPYHTGSPDKEEQLPHFDSGLSEGQPCTAASRQSVPF